MTVTNLKTVMKKFKETGVLKDCQRCGRFQAYIAVVNEVDKDANIQFDLL